MSVGHEIGVRDIHAAPLHFEVTVQLTGELACPASGMDQGSVLVTRFEDPGEGLHGCKLVIQNVAEPDICEYITSFASPCGEGCDGNSPGFEGCAVMELSNTRTEKCYCDVFREFGASPRVRITTDENTILIKGLYESKEALRESIQQLNAFDEIDGVTVRSITEPVADDQGEVKQTIDLSSLTAIQRECLKTALEEGYYDAPREITQYELAEKLDISTSMASNRLRSIHRKLLKDLDI